MNLPSPQMRSSPPQLSQPDHLWGHARLPPVQTAHAPLFSQSFVSVESILPQIGITKQTVKKLEAIHMVREQRENGKQEIAYHARPFVLCGLPLRRPPAGELIHRRQNGKFFLEVVAHPRYGLPFGQDRLILIWVATLAVKQKSRTDHFQRAAQLLEFLQLPKDGIHYRRLIQGFERIFAASIFFGTDEQRVGGQCFDWARFHFFDQMVLWFNRADPQDSGSVPHQGNIITLSEGFYEEINQHPIPVERQVVAGLANAPGLLDFYVWIVWKSWTIKATAVRIPLFGHKGIQAQLGAMSYSRDKRFRQTLRLWLKRINLFWPECPVELSHDGQFLNIYCSKQSPAIRHGSAR